VHVHNMPDFLVFAAWYPKLAGAKVILDIHDVVPELFASKFGANLKSPYVGLLRKIEKLSSAFSDHVIVSNDLWQQTLIHRSVTAEKCSVFLNHVDPEIFYRREKKRQDGKLIIIFPGSFQWHQGLDLGIRALAKVKVQMPQTELHLYGGGGGDQTASLVRLAEELGLKEDVKFCGSVALDDIPQVIANADIGIVPKRADSFGNEAYSTKIMEFMSQGVPVVASQTKIDTFYFGDGVVRFFPSGNSDAMADAILEVARNREVRDDLVARGYDYVENNGWHRKKFEYVNLVDSLSTVEFAPSAARGRSSKVPSVVSVTAPKK
jgi:glycosyltransferase involved in cell wall biosynthesis